MTKEEETKNIQSIIQKSGHNLHTEIVGFLKDADYKTEISPYYVDAYTDKPREVDIIARKRIKIFKDSDDHIIQLILSIDCKYLKHPTVFWNFDNERTFDALKLRNCNVQELITKVGSAHFSYFNTDKTARLFQSEHQNDDQSTTDPIYKACAQAISGTIFAREHSGSTPSITYPLVIVDGPGKFYSADNPGEEMGSVLVHIDYSYYQDRNTLRKPVREPFYVWLVRKEKIEDVIKIVEKEADGLRSYEEDILKERRFHERIKEDRI